MYCVKCGVELARSERKCPLCNTPVYMPEIEDFGEPTYPVYNGEREKVNPRGIYFIASAAFLIAAIISVFCDYNLNNMLNWSGYVVGGLILAYVVIILPGWFQRPHPAVFAPVNFAGAALYLGYVNLAVGGGWFLTFALPVTAGAALIVCSVVILTHYLKRGRLYIWGGAVIATGLFSLLIEWLMHVTFNINNYLHWSAYPAIALGLIGIMLIVIAIVRPFRESLRRIFSL